MELLIIKTGTRYLRIKPSEFLEVNLDKASVFPMNRLPHVKKLEQEARTQGFEDLRIKKLVLSEEDL